MLGTAVGAQEWAELEEGSQGAGSAGVCVDPTEPGKSGAET